MTCANCPHSARGCNGPCPCTLDGYDIRYHWRVQWCPAGKFGTTAEPEGVAVEKALQVQGFVPSRDFNAGGCDCA
jgi:hypothetical protein